MCVDVFVCGVCMCVDVFVCDVCVFANSSTFLLNQLLSLVCFSRLLFLTLANCRKLCIVHWDSSKNSKLINHHLLKVFQFSAKITGFLFDVIFFKCNIL